MADNVEIIRIDTSEAVKSVKELTIEIEEQKLAQRDIKKALKDNTGSLVKLSEEQENSRQKLTKANTERRNAIKLIQSEKGSRNELKNTIKVLQQQNDKLNISTKEGRKQLRENNKQIQSLNKSLKTSQKDIGKTGNAFSRLGSDLQAIPGPIGGVVKGIGGMTKASLKFIATPIGAIIAAIVIALKSLQRFLKGSEEGQNKLNKAMKVFTTIIGNLDDQIQALGKLILDQLLVWGAQFSKFFGKVGLGFQKLKGLFTDNTDSILEQQNKISEAEDVLLKRQEERAKSAEELKSGIKGIVAETKEEIKIAQQLADRQAALDKLQRGFLVGRAKLESEIADLRAKAADKANFTDEERIQFLDEAIKKENEILNTNQKIASEKFEITKIQNSLSNSTKEDLDEQAQLEADLFNVQSENAKKRKALVSELSALQKKANEERIENTNETDEEILTRRGEAITKLLELEQSRIDREATSLEEQKELQIERENEEFERIIQNQQLLDEEKLLLEELHKEKLLEIEGSFQDQMSEKRQIALDDALNGMQQIIDATHHLAGMRVSILSDAFSKIATINFKEVKNAQDAFLQIGQAAQGLTGLIISGHEQELADLEAQKQAKLKLAGDDVKAREKIEGDYAYYLRGLKRAQFIDEKRKAKADAVIAAALGAVKALGSAPPPINIALAAITAGLAAVQIRAIDKQPEPNFSTFAEGGAIVDGASHSQGGVNIYGDNGQSFGNVEGDEAMFVMKKDATAQISALSAINEANGGRSFFGKPTRFAQEGGQLGGVNIDTIVDESLERKPIVVDVVSIETGMTDLDSVRQTGVI